MKKKLSMLVAFSLVLILFTGCMDFSIVNVLEEDNAVYGMNIVIPTEYYTEDDLETDDFTALKKQLDVKMDEVSSKEEIPKEVEEFFESIKILNSKEAFMEEGVEYTKIVVGIKANKPLVLMHLMALDSEEMIFEETGVSEYQVSSKTESLTDTEELAGEETSTQSNDMDEQTLNMLKSSGFKIEYELSTDFEVKQANNTYSFEEGYREVLVWDLLSLLTPTDTTNKDLTYEMEFPETVEPLTEEFKTYLEKINSELSEVTSEENTEEVVNDNVKKSIKEEINSQFVDVEKNNETIIEIRNLIQEKYERKEIDEDFHGNMLKDLGVLKGTDKGLELDKTLTKTEGAIIYARLLGIADSAKEFALSNPNFKTDFTDVPEWPKEIIVFLYYKGLVAGVSETKYVANQDMTETQFTTLMLRALGYYDIFGDFKWDEAVIKAKDDLKVYKSDSTPYENFEGDKFTRRKMAYTAYNFLLQPSKSNKYILFEKMD